MDEQQEEVKVSPEDIAELEREFPEEEEEHQEPIKTPPSPRRRRREEPRDDYYEPPGVRYAPPPQTDPFKQMMSGDVSLGEALLIMDYWDRKERRDSKPPTSEDTAKLVAEILDKYGLTDKPNDEPDWAKEIREQNEGIIKKSEAEEHKREQKELVDSVTKPLTDRLDEESEERKKLEDEVEKLKEDPSNGEPKESGLDQFISYKAKLVTAGFLKADNDSSSGTIKYGEDGIPVSGSIPAWTIYAPHLVDKIFDNIEKRVNSIAGTFGLGGKKKLGDLITLPNRPQTQDPPPPFRSIEPEPEPPEQPAAEPPTEPETELIKLPKREVLEPEIEPEPEVKLEKKTYYCKYCDEGPFDNPLALGRHVKGCEKAIEAKKVEETEAKEEEE